MADIVAATNPLHGGRMPPFTEDSWHVRLGRIANWAVPGRPILGVGGAMDLLAGARRVIVATTHTTRTGEAKLVEECTYPRSGDRRVDLVVTEAATFAVGPDGLRLVEVADGTDPDWVAAHTAAPYVDARTGVPA